MRANKTAIAITFSLVLLGADVPGPAAVAGDPPRSHDDPSSFDTAMPAQIDALFEENVSRKQIAGAVALVARHGKVAYLKAFGSQDAEVGIAMSPETIFRIASMTKPVSSTAVLILADEGRIDVSDPIARYLPEFKFMKVAMPRAKPGAKSAAAGSEQEFDLVPAYRAITIRDLLTHTSGICYRFRDHPLLGRKYVEANINDGLASSDHSLAENVRRLAGLPLANQPGTAWEYGLSTDVLGRLIEVVSGQTLEQFFTDRIFKPLKMNDTSFTLPDAKRSRFSALYEPTGLTHKVARTDDGPSIKGALIYSAISPYQRTNGYFSGGAGLVSTAGDYARFLQMLLNHGELEGSRVLKSDTVSAMTHDQIGPLPMWIPVHGLRFGYGFGINTLGGNPMRDPAGTFSWGGAYYTDFWVDPKHEIIGVMMTQLYPSTHMKLRDEFHRLVNEAIH